MRTYDRFFIGGDWVEPAGTGTLPIVSPATEEPEGSVPVAIEADMDRAVAAARRAFDHGPWPRLEAKERADVLAALSANIHGRMQQLADLITAENGSPSSWSLMGQVLSATMVLDYYAGLARDFPSKSWCRRRGGSSPTQRCSGHRSW